MVYADFSLGPMDDEHLDGEPSTSTAKKSAKKKKKGKNTLKTVDIKDPDDTPDFASPPGSKKKKMTEKKAKGY